MPLTFLTLVTRWSRSTSNFYALIGQNLAGEFIWKIYAASWNLFTLTAEDDRVLCQLVMFYTVFSAGSASAIKSLCYLWLVCLLGFWLGNMSLVKVRNPISDGVIFVFGLAWCVRGLKGLKRFCPYLIAFRSCISNGKPEWLLYWMFAFYILFNEVEHSLCSYLVYARWSRAILALKCDRRWLLFFGCTYKAINSMQDLVHSWTVCKLFFSKMT